MKEQHKFYICGKIAARWSTIDKKLKARIISVFAVEDIFDFLRDSIDKSKEESLTEAVFFKIMKNTRVPAINTGEIEVNSKLFDMYVEKSKDVPHHYLMN